MRKAIFVIGLLLPFGVFGADIGVLGIYPQDINGSMKKAIGISHGVLVGGVVEGSPAEEAGLMSGDVVLTIDQEEMHTERELREYLSARPGQAVELTVLRNDEEWKFKVVLGKKGSEDKSRKRPRGSWGGGGGPVFLWIQPNLEVINNEISDVIGDRFAENMWLIGGGGCGTIWNNLRIGGVGGEGSQIVSGNERQAEFSIEYGGFLAEYIVPLGKFQISLGGVIGGGGVDLKITRAKESSWDGIWDNFGRDSVGIEDYETVLEAGFFHYEPYIGVQYSITQWAYLGVKGGYFGASLSEWSEMGKPISGPPEMKLSNYFVSLGIIFGYFTR